MKLSNKLLIAFAASLILIPVFGMVFISATKYKTGNYMDEANKKPENFSTPTPNMETMAVSKPFGTVNIPDAKNLVLSISIIKDDKFGVKIPSDFKNLITVNVDANGQLQIVIKNIPKEKARYYTTLYIYSPTLKAIDITKADGILMEVKLDSLNVNVKKSESITFNYRASVKKLNVNAEVKDIRFIQADINSLILNLKGAEFETLNHSYDNLIITSSGKSSIDIQGGDEDKKEYYINNLVIKTIDKADVKLKNIEVKNCSGKFSDQTQVQMAAVNLNQMYNKN